MALFELLLGTREPARILIGRDKRFGQAARASVKCPSCNTLHNQRLWTRGAAFGNWWGLFCPSCEAPIPCVYNALSAAIIALTAPVWWPLKRWTLPPLKRRQLKIIRAHESGEIAVPKRVSAWGFGLVWGGSMFLTMTALAAMRQDLTFHLIFGNMLTYGILGSAVFGTFMKIFINRSLRTPEQ